MTIDTIYLFRYHYLRINREAVVTDPAYIESTSNSGYFTGSTAIPPTIF